MPFSQCSSSTSFCRLSNYQSVSVLVILGTVGERVADVTIREKKTPQEPVDSLTKFIAELQKRQNTLKTVAEKCKLKQKQV